MTTWKDHKERRTPFLSRGMGRTTQLEERVTALENHVTALDDQQPAEHLAFVSELPEQPDPSTIYFITQP